MEKQKNQSKKKSLKNIAVFSGIGFQMGITIWLGNLFGTWLDNYYHKDFWQTTITFVAICIAIFSVVLQVQKFSSKND